MNGKWKGGKLNGKGDFSFSNGDQLDAQWNDGRIDGNSTYTCSNGDEITGNLNIIERRLKKNTTLWENAKANIGLCWYAIALEYKSNKNFKRAKETMEKAQKYTPASSDLNKLIHLQLKIVNEKIDNNQL